jgi:hypothetical protein
VSEEAGLGDGTTLDGTTFTLDISAISPGNAPSTEDFPLGFGTQWNHARVLRQVMTTIVMG